MSTFTNIIGSPSLGNFTTSTIYGFLLSNAADTITATAALTDGQVLIGSTENAPVAATLSEGTNIAITSASGSITIALDGIVAVANGGTGVSSLTENAVLLGGATAVTDLGVATDGQLIIGSTGASPVLATLTEGTGISITNAAGAITIAVTAVPGLTWNVVTADTQALVSENGYVATNAVGTTFALPASPVLGDTFTVYRFTGAGNWNISQQGSQQIQLGANLSTAGSDGGLASTAEGDGVTLIYAGDNVFIAFPASGGSLTLS